MAGVFRARQLRLTLPNNPTGAWLSPEELESLVQGVIQELGATSKKEMGAVIKAAQAKAAGRAEGKTISAAVGKLLK